jgi:DNA-binding NtrC family response regulator
MQTEKAKIKILIADDNRDMCTSLQDILTHKGYIVESVNDGYELLAYFKIKKADILILDLMMPGRDGLEMLAPIKSILPDMKVIIYTAFQRYERSSCRTEADRFLLKTAGADKLCEAIEELV